MIWIKSGVIPLTGPKYRIVGTYRGTYRDENFNAGFWWTMCRLLVNKMIDYAKCSIIDPVGIDWSYYTRDSFD